MGCTCHLLRGETCSHCNKWFDFFERPDDIIDPIPGDTLVMLTLDETMKIKASGIAHLPPGDYRAMLSTGGASVDKEAVLTLQQANARKIAARNKRLAQELAHTYRPYSDPDGPPSCQFGNEKLAELQHSAINRELTHEHKLSLAHRIPFAWRWTSLRDDLRMGTSQLFPGEE